MAVSKSMLVMFMALQKGNVRSRPLGCEANMRTGDLRFISRKNFGKGIITNHGQSPAEAFCEPARFGIAEPVEDAMAKQAARAEQRLIDVRSFAVDGADDLETEEIGQEAIGEIQDCADLLAIVGAASHEGSVGVFKDDDELMVGVGAVLIGPEPGKFRL